MTRAAIGLPFDDAALLRRSDFVRVVECGRDVVLFHALAGGAMRCGRGLLELLEMFREPRTLQQLLQEVDAERDALVAAVANCRSHGFLVAAKVDERAELLARQELAVRAIDDDAHQVGITLVLATVCNFGCAYCLQRQLLGDSEQTHPKLMSFDVARSAVDEALGGWAAGHEQFNIHFNGGEILLCWGVMQQVLAYVGQAYPGHDVRFSCNTNAALVTDSVAQELFDHQVTVTTSLDGGRSSHDAVRVTRGGKGTYDQVRRGLETLRRHGVTPSSITAVLTDGNYELFDASIYDVVAELGLSALTLEPDLVRLPRQPIDAIVGKLLEQRVLAAQRGIRLAGSWSVPFERLIAAEPDRMPSHCQAMNGRGYAVFPAGTIRPCAYSPVASGQLGGWRDLRRSGDFIATLRAHWFGAMPECQACELEGLCRGGCAAVRMGAGGRKDAHCELVRQITAALLREHLER